MDEVEFIRVIHSSEAERLATLTLEWCTGGFDWLAVTSRNAVLAMDQIAKAAGHGLGDAIPPAQVATVGEATRSVCASVGLEVALVPGERQDARGIVDDFPDGPGASARAPRGSRISGARAWAHSQGLDGGIR